MYNPYFKSCKVALMRVNSSFSKILVDIENKWAKPKATNTIKAVPDDQNLASLLPCLTHLFPMHPSLPPENIKSRKVF